MVEYWYSYNNLDVAESGLRRSIGQHASRYNYLYIGLTQRSPETRFQEHQRLWQDGHKWERMVVIYQARTIDKMREAEDRLIKYVKQKVDKGRYKCVLWNGRESALPKEAYSPDGYWVYILLGN